MNITVREQIEAKVPRYTSYPTAPHFHAGIGEADVVRWMDALLPGGRVSLYVHVPFCDKLCWFCACHTKHTLRYEPVARFLDVLHAEIRLVAARLPKGVTVDAIHFGGGSPTMLTPLDFTRLVAAIRSMLPVSPLAELSVEIDPNDMTPDRLDALAQAGLTRASLGVQDFDPRVQQAINRTQSFDLTKSVVDGVRQRGAASVNLDLLYGLPHQTTSSLSQTVSRALELRPDRIALFGYAHVPWFKKHQTMIEETSLPGPSERLDQFQTAAKLIGQAGYAAIGIDHFALPGDGLALAAANGRLRRNFQGYTDDQCDTLIGLGPSSVSRFRQGYAQNITATGDYETKVHAGQLPVARGIVLTADDIATAWIIERLMCDFAFDKNTLSELHGDAGKRLLARASAIAADDVSGLLDEGNCFVIAPTHHAITRTVAARFDDYLTRGNARHSAAV